MSIKLTKLENYADDNGNEILCGNGRFSEKIQIHFVGKNNKLIIGDGAKIEYLHIWFDCDNGVFKIGSNNRTAFQGFVRVGQDCQIVLGNNVSTTSRCIMTTAEGTSISLGDDVMLANDIEIRTDDAHPIFDVKNGKRLNMPRDINIGNHVWMAKQVVVLGGVSVGDGCVVGFRSLLKGNFPNNCIVAGIPAKVIKRDIAWERPHLSMHEPFYKPDASYIKKSDYWNMTLQQEDEKMAPPHKPFFLKIRNLISKYL